MLIRDTALIRYDFVIDFVIDGRSRSIPLTIDDSDQNAAATLESTGSNVRSFDSLTTVLAARLRDCFVVLHERKAVFGMLRFELPPDRCFDVGTSIILRNDALHFGSIVSVPLSPTVRSTCRHLEPYPSKQCSNKFKRSGARPHQAVYTSSEAGSASHVNHQRLCGSASWRSSPAGTLALEESLNLEALSYRASWLRILRSRQQIIPLADLPISNPAFIVALRMW